MDGSDPVLSRVAAAAATAAAGDRDGARVLFDRLWAEVGPDGDPLHRCAIAHAAADVQDDLRTELTWDLRALDAAGRLTDDRAAGAGVAAPVVAFFPSLHLNVGDSYRRIGDLESACRHEGLGRAALASLPDDGYERMVRSGLDRLAERLSGGRDARGGDPGSRGTG